MPPSRVRIPPSPLHERDPRLFGSSCPSYSVVRSERWQSGRMRRSRKPLRVVRLVEGSNPSLSAQQARHPLLMRVQRGARGPRNRMSSPSFDGACTLAGSASTRERGEFFATQFLRHRCRTRVGRDCGNRGDRGQTGTRHVRRFRFRLRLESGRRFERPEPHGPEGLGRSRPCRGLPHCHAHRPRRQRLSSAAAGRRSSARPAIGRTRRRTASSIRGARTNSSK